MKNRIVILVTLCALQACRHGVEIQGQGSVAANTPARACTAAEKREVFAQGAAGLVAAAGRQHAHVSRVCRAVLGQTPTEYVNAIRMDYAARQLSGSTASLTEIALDCGIENLSHFHRLFKARHGMPPKAWRRRYQRSVLQPL